MLKLMLLATILIMVAGLVTGKLTLRDIWGYVKVLVVLNIAIVKCIYVAIKTWIKTRPINVEGNWVS